MTPPKGYGFWVAFFFKVCSMIYWAMHGGSLFIGMIPNPFIGSSHWFLMEHVGKYTSPHGSYGFVHGRFDLFRPTCGDLINTHEPHPSNELLATWSFQGLQCHCPSFWGGLHAIHIYIYTSLIPNGTFFLNWWVVSSTWFLLVKPTVGHAANPLRFPMKPPKDLKDAVLFCCNEDVPPKK